MKLQTKLKKLSAEKGLDINKLRIVFALERLVARVSSSSKLFDALIYKGGFMLLKKLETGRFTRDIDVLAKGVSVEEIFEEIQAVCKLELNDEITFLNPVLEELPGQEPYAAYRISLNFFIGERPKNENARLSRVYLDVTFNDVVFTEPDHEQMPSEFNLYAPTDWKTYSVEQQFAEKLETLVNRGAANSRAKDFYDLTAIFPKINDKTELVKALEHSFSTRSTGMPDLFVEYFQNLNTVQLEKSWGSVELAGNDELTFKKCFERLIQVLGLVDKEILKKVTLSH